jgi:hypothetical protein
MSTVDHRFEFSEVDSTQVHGRLELDEPLPFRYKPQGSGFYRQGKMSVDGCSNLELVLYHSQPMETFMYLRNTPVDLSLLRIAGLTDEEIAKIRILELPGQLCMGAERARTIRHAINDIFASPMLSPVISSHQQQNMAVFPIAREGLKYQVAEAIYENYDYYCDEIILDAHHVFDSSVPIYNRKVEMTLFKDKDLDKSQKEDITVAFIADSIASGLVMKETIERIKERFEHVQQVEVISPLATIRGLCRIARSECIRDIHVRVHVFETLLNALPPDYYYSAHFNVPELHIRPDLEEAYRAWWGQDTQGNCIADTACAGYGWSEAFFSPRKQIQMMNGELGSRHNLTIADILRRNMR